MLMKFNQRAFVNKNRAFKFNNSNTFRTMRKKGPFCRCGGPVETKRGSHNFCESPFSFRMGRSPCNWWS